MQNDVLKNFYEKDADRFWDPALGMRGRDLTIYSLLSDLSGRVLEYGAGSGSLLLNLALEDRFSSLIGVDISENALRKMQFNWDKISGDKKISSEKLTLLTSINDQLPQISDGSVDVIMSLDTIEHVMDPYVVLDELYRIGSPESVFIISVPNYGYIKYVLQLMLGQQPITGGGEPVDNWRTSGWDGWHLHTFTKQSLDILLKDCGWIPIKWTGYGDKFKSLGLGFLRQNFPSFWSGALTVVCKKRK
jgi:SAM-dependent methyltransferase